MTAIETVVDAITTNAGAVAMIRIASDEQEGPAFDTLNGVAMMLEGQQERLKATYEHLEHSNA